MRRTLPLVLLSFVGPAAFHTIPADAAITHQPLGLTFGAFTRATDVTVDQSNGNVYVTDSGADVVDIFGASGGSPAGGIVQPLTGTGEPPAPLFAFRDEPSAVAIDESGGPSNRALYVSDARNDVVDKFTFDASSHEYKPACQFTGPGNSCTSFGGAPGWHNPDGVAVDAGGNVYIANYGSEPLGGVYEFNSAGVSARQLVGGLLERAGPVAVAVTAAGTLYVNNYYFNVVKLDPEGHESILDRNKPRAVAVDSHENVYVDDGTYIAEYDSQGKPIGRFGEGVIGSSEGVAVNNSSEDVYVSDRGHEDIEVFGPPVTVPDVATGEAVKVHKTSATITGTVDPDGVEGGARYYFQWGKSTSYEEPPTPEGLVGEGSGPVQESASLAGLERETIYHYRLVAVDKNGTSYGKDQTFTTVSAVYVTPCIAGEVTATSARLGAITDPEGTPATFYEFQYGLNTEYGASVGLKEFAAVEAEEPYSAHIEGLTPNTLYHCRLVGKIGENGEGGFSEGADATFTTPIALPTVNDQRPFATDVSLHEATLHGTLNPGNGVTTYHFVYGLTFEYGSSTPDAYTPQNYRDDPVEQLITGLQPGLTYHYALVATNASGTRIGPDETFTTLSGARPLVETGGVSGVSPSGATISGVVDPRGGAASYAFELGISTSYGTRVFGSFAPGSTAETVTAGFVGLLPGTTYHYRLTAANAGGPMYGGDQTFTTPGLPITIVQPTAPALLPTPVFPVIKPVKPPPPKCRKGLVRKGRRCVKQGRQRAKKRHG